MRALTLVAALLTTLMVGCVTPPEVRPRTSTTEQAQRLYLQALELAAQKDYAEALRTFQSVLEHDPLRFEAHYWSGVCYYELGEYALEIAEYTKCHALNPNYPPVWKALGHAYLSADDLDGAKQAYGRYLGYEPLDARVVFNLGLVEMDLGNLDGARKHWRKFLILKHEDPRLEREAQQLLLRVK